jgi:hypothetical protein
MNGNQLAKTAYALVMIHFVVNLVHGWAHEDKTVPVTFGMYLFIIPVIMIAPFVAAALIWKRRERAGYALLSASMVGSFLFGLSYHFLIQGPDHVGHVQGGLGASVFFWSSLGLALVEAGGALFAVYGLIRHSGPDARTAARAAA